MKFLMNLRIAVVALWPLLVAESAVASVVERVIAVVGDQAILLSDLRARARPFLARIHEQLPHGAQRAAATSQLYGQLLDRMIEEELERLAAGKANVTVTAREVDDALARIAAQNNVTVQVVINEARRSGLNERQYRQEIRRQLLEAKLLNLRVQGRLRVTEDDLRTAYQKLVQEERKRLTFRAAWIRLGTASRGPEQLHARRRLAEQLVEQARTGVDFGALARQHSDDPTTRQRGGVLGQLRPGQLPAALDTVARGLEVGAVSEPIRQGDEFVVLKVVDRQPSALPTFEEARDELGQRVYMEKMEQARNAWLKGLRKRTHVDVRL